MAHTNGKRLDHGDAFPPLTLEAADGAAIQLPAATEEDGWLALLVYRGHW